jgi:hypothetical protein
VLDAPQLETSQSPCERREHPNVTPRAAEPSERFVRYRSRRQYTSCCMTLPTQRRHPHWTHGCSRGRGRKCLEQRRAPTDSVIEGNGGLASGEGEILVRDHGVDLGTRRSLGRYPIDERIRVAVFLGRR